MIRLMICVLGIFTIGCLNYRGPHHPVAGEEIGAIGAATDAWLAAGRPDPLQLEECSPMERTEIVIVSDRSPCVTFVRNEQGETVRGPNASACMRVVQPYIGAAPQLNIYLDISLDRRGRLNGIAHEMLHHFYGCIGLATIRRGEDWPWVGSGYDGQHEDTELWGDILNNALSQIR